MNTSNRFNAPLVLGMDERIPARPDSAELIENMTFERRTNGWDSRIGYESYFPIVTTTYPVGLLKERVDSIYIWSKLQGAQRFLIGDAYDSTSQKNKLVLVCPHLASPVANPGVYELDTGRSPVGLNDYSTQYIPYGDYLIVLNGQNKPMKFKLWPFDFQLTDVGESPDLPLGFQGVPAPPSAWSVAPIATNLAKRYPGNNVQMPVKKSSMEGGLGTANTAETEYKGEYAWRVTYVYESGAEGPISPASNTVVWPGAYTAADFNRPLACMIEIPRGPKGTVARRIYRTKDMSGGFSSSYYFVAQVDNNVDTLFYDHVSDTAMGALAPEDSDSVILPAPKSRFGASFNNCLFLESGANTGPRLYWSYPGKPDQFALLDFIDFGMTTGGAITALHSHYNLLLVFRERSVEAVTGSYPNFVTGNVINNIGCVGPNATVSVPGLGVMFIAKDGIYLVSGGFEGGSQVDVIRVSDVLMDTWRDVNDAQLSRAVCAYSPKWREAHFYVPTAGEDRPNLGIVYHQDKQCFSLRRDFPVGSITTTPEGDFVFGHNKGVEDNDADEYGVFVISRSRQAGYAARANDQAAIVDASAPTSKFHSPALDFGAPEVKKYVKYVYLYVLTNGGDNAISMTYVLDDAYQGTVSESRQQQRADHPDQDVMDTAVIGTDVWEKGLVTEVRFPVPEKACNRFQFQISTSSDVVLIGYTVEYNVTGTRVITGQFTSTTRSRA